MARLPRLLLVGVLAAVITPINGQSPASGKPSINNGEWPDYSGDLRGWRYSPLDQINANNFNQLAVPGASRPIISARAPSTSSKARR